MKKQLFIILVSAFFAINLFAVEPKLQSLAVYGAVPSTWQGGEVDIYSFSPDVFEYSAYFDIDMCNPTDFLPYVTYDFNQIEGVVVQDLSSNQINQINSSSGLYKSTCDLVYKVIAPDNSENTYIVHCVFEESKPSMHEMIWGINDSTLNSALIMLDKDAWISPSINLFYKKGSKQKFEFSTTYNGVSNCLTPIDFSDSITIPFTKTFTTCDNQYAKFDITYNFLALPELDSIKIDGVKLASFDPAKYVYNITLPSGSIVYPSIEYFYSDGSLDGGVVKGAFPGEAVITLDKEYLNALFSLNCANTILHQGYATTNYRLLFDVQTEDNNPSSTINCFGVVSGVIVEGAAAMDVVVYDSKSAVVYQGKIQSDKEQLPISLVQGIYLVKIDNTTKRVVVK